MFKRNGNNVILVFSQRPLARGRVKQSDFRAREGSSCVFAGCRDDLTSHLIRDLWLMSPYVLWEEETVYSFLPSDGNYVLIK